MTALLSKMNDWFKFWWLKIPEPRSHSIIFAGVYFGSMLGGLFVYMFPPETMLGAAGEVTMNLIGIFYFIGGLIGAISGTREAWRLERIGVYLIMLGLGGYFTVVTHAAFHTENARYAHLTAVYFAFFLFISRLVMIWQYTYKPNTNRIFLVSPDG